MTGSNQHSVRRVSLRDGWPLIGSPGIRRSEETMGQLWLRFAREHRESAEEMHRDHSRTLIERNIAGLFLTALHERERQEA